MRGKVPLWDFLTLMQESVEEAFGCSINLGDKAKTLITVDGKHATHHYPFVIIEVYPDRTCDVVRTETLSSGNLQDMACAINAAATLVRVLGLKEKRK